MKPFTLWIEPIPRYCDGHGMANGCGYVLLCKRNYTTVGYSFGETQFKLKKALYYVADSKGRFNYGFLLPNKGWQYYYIT